MYETYLKNQINTMYDAIQNYDDERDDDERAELEAELADLELDASDW